MFGILIITILLGLVPWILGKPWSRLFGNKRSDVLAYCLGFFLELALFHIISFPLFWFQVSFIAIRMIYTFCLCLCIAVCLYIIWKQRLFPQCRKLGAVKSFFWYDWLLLVAVLAVIGIQVVRGFTYDITNRSYDDATYTVQAMDALASDYIGMIDSYTGVAGTLNMDRVFQTYLFFPAWLTSISGISLATMEHSILYVQLLLLAYLIYTWIAGEFFQNRMNQLIFLLLIAVFYIYGYHTIYSLTYRLLGPNYQGKAVLTVSLTPLVLTIMIQILNRSYQWRNGLLLFLLSMAAASLTLMGTGTMVVIVTIPVIISLFRKERNWKHLLYILWSSVAPAGFVFVYVLYKYAV